MRNTLIKAALLLALPLAILPVHAPVASATSIYETGIYAGKFHGEQWNFLNALSSLMTQHGVNGGYYPNNDTSANFAADYYTSGGATFTVNGSNLGVTHITIQGGANWTKVSDGGTQFAYWSSGGQNVGVYIPDPIPAAPSSVSGSCSGGTPSISMSWPSSTYATYYAVRVEKDGVWNGSCNPSNQTGNYCGNVNSTSFGMSGNSGSSYSSWVHGCSSSGCSSSATQATYSCSMPSVAATWNGITNLTVAYNSSATFGWTSSNDTYCNVTHPYAGSDWNGAPTSYSNTYTNLKSNDSTTITCFSGSGQSAASTATLTVCSPGQTVSNNACVSPGNGSCPATTIGNCSLPTTSSGGSAGSCASGYSGSCNYSCSNGTWSQVTNSCTASSCSNGANNPAACTQCPSGLAWNSSSSSCVACSNGGCTGAGGSSSNPTGSLSCNNGASNPPSCTSTAPTATLSASPSSITSGQSSTLTWSSSNATSCAAAGGFSTGGATSGSASVSPATTSTYQVTCTGPGGSASASRQVTVTVPTISITADPDRVHAGDTSTISWDSSDVTSCAVSGPGLSSNKKSGNKSVTISSQSTYTATCQTSGSPVTDSVTVNVVPAFTEF